MLKSTRTLGVEMPIQKSLKVLIECAIFAVFLTLFTSALSVYGVISVGLARILLIASWIVAMFGIVTSEIVCQWPKRKIWAVTILSGLALGIALFCLDHWAVGYKTKMDAKNEPPATKYFPLLPPFALDKAPPRLEPKKKPTVINGNKNHIGDTTQNCPNGVCINGDNYGNPQVFNTPPPPPPPVVTWRVGEVDSSRLGAYRVKLVITVQNPLPKPGFIAYCDRPCNVDSEPMPIGVFGGTAFGQVPGHPDMVFGTLQFPDPIPDGAELTWWIFSVDGQPMKILKLSRR